MCFLRDGANKRSNGFVKSKNGYPEIHYKLCKEDARHIRKGLQATAEINFAAGAKEVYTLTNRAEVLTTPDEVAILEKIPVGSGELTMFSAHPMGTARMTANGTGTVSPQLELEGYPGIYVADASVLPTSLGVNPMITILATVARGLDLSHSLGLR